MFNILSREKRFAKNELLDSDKSITFQKGEAGSAKELNGVRLDKVEEMPRWDEIEDVPLANETGFELGPDESHLRQSAGIIVVEPDNRVWIYEPKNHFGGYEHTFPKGRLNRGLTPQQSALKETLEETGLLVEITDWLGDYAKSVTKTRYYIGKRIAGDPGMADSYSGEGATEEVENVKLVPVKKLKEFLNKHVDQRIAEDLLKKLNFN